MFRIGIFVSFEWVFPLLNESSASPFSFFDGLKEKLADRDVVQGRPDFATCLRVSTEEEGEKHKDRTDRTE